MATSRTFLKAGPPVLFLALGLQACSHEPKAAELEFSLSDRNLESLEEFGASQADLTQIENLLEAFFGTPAQPRYLVTAEWADDGYDPNWPAYPADEMGSGEISDELYEEIEDDNRWRFRNELKAIEEGRYEDVGRWRFAEAAPRLEGNWNRLLADWNAGDVFEDEDTFKEEAEAMFVGYYPSLIDSAELYRQQCQHCHGNSGGGDGPTARFLKPLPRDYRLGIFKFTGLKDKSVPRREDLMRIITDGVYTTAMPSFQRFSLAERHGLVDYVRLLAIRGQLETQIAVHLVDEEMMPPIETVVELYSEIWDEWDAAEEMVVVFDGDVPREATAEMIAHGKELFNDPNTGNCFSCHGTSGRGDGESAYQLNEDGEKVSAYQDDWGVDIEPRDLTQGVFRFGGRPIDIYRRIYAGINGTPMPALGESLNAEGERVVSDDDIWAMVYYVLSLSDKPREAVAFAGSHGHGHDHGEHGHDHDHGDHDHDHGEGEQDHDHDEGGH